jgi:hypothetical protein
LTTLKVRVVKRELGSDIAFSTTEEEAVLQIPAA